MQIFEFKHKGGFEEYADFINANLTEADHTDTDLFSRLMYHHYDDLLPKSGWSWITTYRNEDAPLGFQFIIAVENPADVEYIICRTFPDYLEFMRMYLPTIQNMNAAADEHNKSLNQQ